MKKLLTVLLIGIFLINSVSTATDIANLKFSITVTENIYNTGIRVVEEDMSGSITNKTTFDTVYNSSTSSITLSYLGRLEEASLVKHFTVLVRRGSINPLAIGVSPSPLKKEGDMFYLGYNIKMGASSFIDTTNTPSVAPPALGYSASFNYGDGIIRDVAVFTLTIPQTDEVPIGEYTADLVFTIEAP